MSRGGKREGAGRKVGSVNQITQEARERAAATGELPLDYMLRVMRDGTVDYDRRDRMAIAASPYVHAKLAQSDVNAKVTADGAITFTWQQLQKPE